MVTTRQCDPALAWMTFLSFAVVGLFYAKWYPYPEARLAQLAQTTQASGAFGRWMGILWRMAARLIPEYIVLILVLGAARAWLFPHVGPEIGNQLVCIVA